MIRFPGLEFSAYANKLVVGEPLTIVKLYKNTGVDPQTGVYKMEDKDKNGVINEKDQQCIRNIGAVFYGGLQNTFSYKSLQLTFLLQFVKQLGYNNLYNARLSGLSNQNQPISVLDRWQAPGDNAATQKFTGQSGSDAGLAYNSFRNSASLISDASYIRLKYISFSYQLPQRWMHSATVYIRGQNLLTFTNYAGLDPETRHQGLPPLKVLTAGFNITL